MNAKNGCRGQVGPPHEQILNVLKEKLRNVKKAFSQSIHAD
jgi:hypothetical protein